MIQKPKKQTPTKKTPFYKHKPFLLGVGIPLVVILLVAMAFRLSPRPGAMVIRAVFDSGSTKVKAALQKHTPPGITKVSDQQYIASDKDAYLDAYYPTQANTNNSLPTVIWTHGGGWLSGDKANVEPYFRLLASKGYAVISLNYSLAPGRTYPAQIHQLNQAHSFVVANAAHFHADTNKIFLAGDSAGAQLSAELAAIITNPLYAKEVGITPSLNPSRLKGVILNCGIYKMEGLTQPNPTLPKIIGWGDDVTVWAYSGTRDFKSPIIRQMSPYYYVTKDFPPTYITGGNADPLTNEQSKPLADKLGKFNVPVSQLFYAADHQPELPHEYQFNLDNADGQKALEAMLSFIGLHI